MRGTIERCSISIYPAVNTWFRKSLAVYKDLMNKYASRLVLFLMILLALPGLLFVLAFGYLLVASWRNSLTPEESVRLAKDNLERFLTDGETKTMVYAICQYNPETLKERDAWVSCTIDIKEFDKIIHYEAILNESGGIRYDLFEREKR